MVFELDDLFQNNIALLDNVTKQSGNLRTDLRKDIKTAIRGLTEVFQSLKLQISDLQKDVNTEQATDRESENYGGGALNQYRYQSYFQPNILRSYSEVLKPQVANVSQPVDPVYRVIIRPVQGKSMTSEDTRKMIKDKLNPAKMKVGVNRMIAISGGGVLVQSVNRHDCEKITSEINLQCRDNIKAEVGVKRRPRLIIYDIPDDINETNISEIVKEQNSDMFSEDSYFEPKYIISNRLNKSRRNIVVEVDGALRKKFLFHKIKIQWTVCRVADYLYLRRCFNCSRFHGGSTECRGELTCPLCSESHDIRCCTKTRDQYKCINCIKHNERANNKNKVNTGHSAADRDCPTYQIRLASFKQTIDYGQ